jgi:hypothetical protein
MGFVNPILGGGGALVRPAMRSPNYVAGTSGWITNRAGNAEFNDLVLRGMFAGNNYVVSEDGEFFYSGTPAAGNMTGSWAAMAGTDPYGNAYTAGLTLYSAAGNVFLGGDGQILSTGSSGSTINIQDGQVTFETPGNDSGALILQDFLSGNGSLSITAGAESATGRAACLDLHTSATTPTAGQQDTYPRLGVRDLGGASHPAHLYVSGAVVKADGDAQISEVWHTVGATGEPAYATGWAGGSTSGVFESLKYRLDAEDNVHIVGVCHATAAAPASTVFTLPSAYCPAMKQRVLADTFVTQGSASTANAAAIVNTSGIVQLFASAAVASSQNFAVNVKFPLGGLA